jgi:hypothetical protein
VVLRITKIACSVSAQFKSQGLGLAHTHGYFQKKVAAFSLNHAPPKYGRGLISTNHVTSINGRLNNGTFEVKSKVNTQHRGQRTKIQKY